MLKLNTILSFTETHRSIEECSTLNIYEGGYLGFNINTYFRDNPGYLIITKADVVAFFKYCQQVANSSKFNEYQPGNLFITEDGILIEAKPDSQSDGYCRGVTIELFPEQGGQGEYSMFLSLSNIDWFFGVFKRKGLL